METPSQEPGPPGDGGRPAPDEGGRPEPVPGEDGPTSEGEAEQAASIAALSEARRANRGEHFLRAAFVGLAAGGLAVLFRYALTAVEDFRQILLAKLHHHPAWGWVVLPLIGLVVGCFVGWSTRRFAPEAGGSGIPHLKGVLLHVRTLHWKRLIPVKFINGVLGIGAGLSAGREGPTVQMGAAIAQAVGQVLRVRPREMPQLLSCGAGAGLAAAFNAPLAGFIFVLEELQRELSPLTYGGALIASVAAAAVTRAFSGQLPSFEVKNFPALPLEALPLLVVLGVATGLLGVAFNRALLTGMRRVHALKRIPPWLYTGLVIALLGLVAWWMPEAVGGGHPVASRLLANPGQFAAVFLIELMAAKFLLTVLSYTTGAPGGVFAPMLLMGAILGLLFGETLAVIWPVLSGYAAAFAVLGMAGFFASSVRAPLTGIVLILEMTGNYEQLFALAVVCLVAYLIAERLRDRPLYESLLEYDLSRENGEAHGVDGVRQVTMGIHRGSELDGKLVRESKLPAGCLIVGVERNGRELLPSAALELRAGDHITVLVPGERPGAAMQVVDLCRVR
ncbi:MAG: H(+)/Cl(-) exchange transporter ClcA [Phycisphaerales bacterium]|nr:H(+)/Cl(-) exchange transporter ClcA [Phycisphaerales bacterium]